MKFKMFENWGQWCVIEADRAENSLDAIYKSPERYRCKLADTFTERLAIGVGCSSNLNSWRRDFQERKGERQ